MSLMEIRDATAEWMERHLPWGEAILVGVRRSAPREPGARFAAAADGSVAGMISAGCVESDLREHALECLASGAPRLVTYGISDEQAIGVGLSCGGEIDILIRPADHGDEVWTAVLDLLRGGEAGALLTGMSEGNLGRRMLVRADGSSVGDLGVRGVPPAEAGGVRRLLRSDAARPIELADGSVAFLDPILPPRHLVVVGATPVAAVLARMATLAGFRVTVVDPREALARPDAFPEVTLARQWPEEAFAELAVDPWTDVAVVAHDERLDVPALAGALRAGCRYVGLLGGSRTQRLRREALRADGLPPSDVDRIHGPIGLDIGARSPAEIAVAILAQILAERLGGPASDAGA